MKSILQQGLPFPPNDIIFFPFCMPKYSQLLKARISIFTFCNYYSLFYKLIVGWFDLIYIVSLLSIYTCYLILKYKNEQKQESIQIPTQINPRLQPPQPLIPTSRPHHYRQTIKTSITTHVSTTIKPINKIIVSKW